MDKLIAYILLLSKKIGSKIEEAYIKKDGEVIKLRISSLLTQNKYDETE